MITVDLTEGGRGDVEMVDWVGELFVFQEESGTRRLARLVSVLARSLVGMRSSCVKWSCMLTSIFPILRLQ
jgi:hypothetical protein